MGALWIEPFGGLAGDMFLAALLDLRDPRFRLDDLKELAEGLLPGVYRLELETVRRGSLSGSLLRVRASEQEDHRHLVEVEEILNSAPLSSSARERALAVFRRIAQAEAHVHGMSVEEVHFHEVGAADSLLDICGAALALELLSVERVFATPPLTGEGSIRCAHGEMPIPAPGTLELLRGRPLRRGGGQGERLTPTGAALLAELSERFDPPELFTAELTGYGAGEREFEEGPPNLVRVQLGELARELGRGADGRAPRAEVWLVEFNVDDMTGEELGFCIQELRAAGALEVWTTAIQMKKDRPGVCLSLLCRPEQRDALEAVAFARSSTLGVRSVRYERTECAREVVTVEFLGETVRMKRRLRPGAHGERPAQEIEWRDLSPEYDDLAALARRTGRSLSDLTRELIEKSLRQIQDKAISR